MTEIRGPIDPLKVPRFAGPATFARLPRFDEVDRADVAIVGIPFDAGTTYRPGARFGPISIRAGSRLLRAYNPSQDVLPFTSQQVVDAGDIACTPFDIDAAIEAIQDGARALMSSATSVVVLGGDHTISLPMLRAVNESHGPVAILHFDAHLDTWDSYFGAAYTHGTPFRRAWEEGLLLDDRSVHVGIRGPLFSPDDLADDGRFGFRIITSADFDDRNVASLVEQARARIGDAPLYVSVDIDVLDPAAAPGTGTPEAGGLTSRELLAFIRGLKGSNIVAADVVEVSPAYDHAEVTAIAAAHVVYELVSLFTASPERSDLDALS
jgi:agmatinase